MKSLVQLRKRILMRLDPAFISKHNARTSKRLDIAAAQIADVFHLAGFRGKYPLKEKVATEIGSGWVLSHSLVFWLLGAKRCIATDIASMARPESLRLALDNSVLSLVRD